MNRFRALRQAVLATLLLAGSAAVFAQAPPAGDPPRQRAPQREDLPDSVRRVERETGGEVLRAEPMQRDGREVYRFKVLTSDGRVRVMQDDPSARDHGDRGSNRGRRQGQDGSQGNGNREKRPSRDPDGEPPQF